MTSSWETQVKAQIRRRYAVQAEAAGNGAEKAIEAGYPAELIAGLTPALTASYSGCGYLFDGLNFEGDETVVDLGAGAGLDSFIAAKQLSNGRVVSVDMTYEMLQKVNSQQLSINLLCADIEYLPVLSGCADVVIANASFNLAISKTAAFSEAYRVLKEGGKLVARDLIKTEELPAEVLTDPLSFNTSLGGALEEEALSAEIEKAGFKDVSISDHRPFSYVTSVKIEARKPYPGP
ncbi:MAG: methyltransferase domain-containing protein [Rhodospirillaceae bacterium]|nr:methyltransferase domain-containing protein [Rhodospirillaceae bacterium]MBT7266297.1 methyltransferase domain-containing protein [Rhodospirillaceae bacterium]